MRSSITPILIMVCLLSLGAGGARAGSLSGFVEFLKTLRDRIEQIDDGGSETDGSPESDDASGSREADAQAPRQPDSRSKSPASRDGAEKSASTRKKGEQDVRFDLSGRDPASAAERKQPESGSDQLVQETPSVARESKSANSLMVFDLNGERPATGTAILGATDRARRGGVFASAADAHRAFARSAKTPLAGSAPKGDPVDNLHRRWAGLNLPGLARGGRPGAARIPAFRHPHFMGSNSLGGGTGKGNVRFDNDFERFRDTLFKDISVPTDSHGSNHAGGRGFFEILAEFIKSMDSITLGLLATVGFGLFSLLWSVIRSPT